MTKQQKVFMMAAPRAGKQVSKIATKYAFTRAKIIYTEKWK